MQQQNLWSRRAFVTTVAGAGSALALSPLLTACGAAKKGGSLASVLANTLGVDTHNHLDVPFDASQIAGLQVDLRAQLQKSGLSAICLTFQVDRPDLKKEGEAYDRFVTGLDALDAVLKSNNLQRALNLSDLKKAHQAKSPVVIQSVEGGHFLEGKIERLAMAYQRGLRVLGLLHDNQSSPPLGDIYTDPPKFGGLTEFGKNVVKECNKLGVLIDLTHCSNDAINDALEVSTRPLLLSHTGLNTQLGKDEKMANMMRPRLISKEQAKIVANAGGVIGVWTHLASSPAEYAQNVRALVDVVGVEHVCMGTDTKMAVPQGANTRLGQQTNTAWDNLIQGFLPTVAEALLGVGFTEAEIGKIAGGNFCRIFDQATGK